MIGMADGMHRDFLSGSAKQGWGGAGQVESSARVWDAPGATGGHSLRTSRIRDMSPCGISVEMRTTRTVLDTTCTSVFLRLEMRVCLLGTLRVEAP